MGIFDKLFKKKISKESAGLQNRQNDKQINEITTEYSVDEALLIVALRNEQKLNGDTFDQSNFAESFAEDFPDWSESHLRNQITKLLPASHDDFTVKKCSEMIKSLPYDRKKSALLNPSFYSDHSKRKPGFNDLKTNVLSLCQTAFAPSESNQIEAFFTSKKKEVDESVEAALSQHNPEFIKLSYAKEKFRIDDLPSELDGTQYLVRYQTGHWQGAVLDHQAMISIPVWNMMLDFWGITAEECWRYAEENTKTKKTKYDEFEDSLKSLDDNEKLQSFSKLFNQVNQLGPDNKAKKSTPNKSQSGKKVLRYRKPFADSAYDLTNGTTFGLNPGQNRDSFSKVSPDPSLYAHLTEVERPAQMFGGLANVVVNANGSEFEGQDFDELADNENLTKTARQLFESVNKYDQNSNYELDAIALELAKVFRVNEDAFDDGDDIECEINFHLIKKAYMISALRSFAWTLQAYAIKQNANITEIPYLTFERIGEFIRERKWLNYKADSHFNGLCGHTDLHVMYLPDSMPDKNKNNVAYIYVDVLPTSLDSLRNDLDELLPAMQIIHDNLLQNRDRKYKLDKPLGDVLHAWCSLVVCAKSPFYSEDGPMTYSFSQITTDLNKPVKSYHPHRKLKAPNHSHQ